MLYIFGTTNRNGRVMDTVKTVGERHSELSGRIAVTNNYPTESITDEFTVVENYKSSEDSQGNCYDWYTIDNHSRYIDRFTPVKKVITGDIADTQDAVCELSEDLAQRIADIEDALCELTEEE